jgi:hypothetical protein
VCLTDETNRKITLRIQRQILHHGTDSRRQRVSGPLRNRRRNCNAIAYRTSGQTPRRLAQKQENAPWSPSFSHWNASGDSAAKRDHW